MREIEHRVTISHLFMKSTPSLSFNPPPLIRCVFFISLIYWLYLAFVTHMVVVQDAFVFHNTAKLIDEQGWTSYFKNGPGREPFYPFMIAFSMILEKLSFIPYQDIQKLIQIGFLASAQYLTWTLLKRLHIHHILSAVILLYMAFSPDIVNASVSLFSEIVAFPVTVLLILNISSLFQYLQQPGSYLKDIIIKSLFVGFLFFVLISMKGAFEFIFPILILSLIGLCLISKQKKGYVLLSVLILAVTVCLPLHLIKSLNKHFNGNYVLTDRGAFMLYGNTTRHLDDFSLKRVAIGAICSTQASNQNICHRLFGQEACAFWDFKNSDAYASQKSNELTAQGLKPEQVNKELVKLSLQKILQDPLHYIPFYIIEGLGVIFWKSGEIGFVAYPDWLNWLYEKTPVRFVISLLSASLTLIAFIYLGFKVFLILKQAWKKHQPLSNEDTLLFFIFITCFSFIGLHALISVQTRYCLPIVPLYLATIAYFLNKFLKLK
jgi:hypothetical protein